MADGKQPELAIALTNTAAILEPGNDRSEDSNTRAAGSTRELGQRQQQAQTHRYFIHQEFVRSESKYENMLPANTSEESSSIDALETTNPAEEETMFKTAEKEFADVSREVSKTHIVETNDNTSCFANGNTEKNEQARTQDDSNENDGDNTTDEHLKKSHTYLLLLAIIAVSLTYQSGLNPPGGFWFKREDNNSTVYSVLNDNKH
ncbi:hypothetical protein BAE44_0002643 [Dichanthelium oligosanthes]|uniref:PGG domain-containing protein n=1 Tax=Dichanthelium oligosanthes TaxID=888268 RepID=A0A1E5WG12_9POAL|nr:hypothetical protein BAE44_0002643 [Dichanthelium oligosanthes]